MATGLFGHENPLGHRLAQAGGENLQWGEIVGVAADVKSILPDPGPVTYQLYQPMAQEPRARNEIAVRTAGVATSALVDTIRTTMTGLDPDLAVRRLQPADASIDGANFQMGVLRDLLASFAVLGLGLASLGIYGIIARTMAQRTSEFAIRLALGAGIRDITSLVLTSGVKLALTGAALACSGRWAFPDSSPPLSRHAARQSTRVARHHVPAHRRRAGRLLAPRPTRRQGGPDRGVEGGVILPCRVANFGRIATVAR